MKDLHETKSVWICHLCGGIGLLLRPVYAIIANVAVLKPHESSTVEVTLDNDNHAISPW